MLTVLVVIPMIGWLRILGERARWYGSEFGTGLFVISTILTFTAVVWFNARMANRADAEIQRLNYLLGSLSDINRSILTTRERADLFQRVCTIAVQRGQLVLCCIALKKEGSIELVEKYGPSARYLCEAGGKGESLWDEPAMQLAVARAAPVVINDVAHHAPTLKTRNAALAHHVASIAIFPIVTDGSLIGVAVFCASEPFYFQAKEIEVLGETAMAIGHALDRMAVEDRRRVAEHELKVLNEELETRVASRTHALESANRELEAFSYSVSHDLRAPLRAIGGFAAMLDDHSGPVLDEEGKRMLGIIQKSSTNMGQLIDALLMLSQLGRQEMSSEPIDMTSLVSDVWREFQAAELHPSAELRLQPLPQAMGHPSLVRQLLVNLIGNALKYSSSRSEPVVEVGARCTEEGTVYCVRDNGVGFDMRHAGRVCEVFQRLHASSDFPGTGIGLAVVDRVVKRHGGRVWAEGAPGVGAAFYFTLSPPPIPSDGA